jgi:hypothetical protein
MASTQTDDAAGAQTVDSKQESGIAVTDSAVTADTEQQTGTVVADAEVTADTEQQPGAVVADAEEDIEEGRDAYQPGGYHPVYIGDVYADKYEVMSKIGYGRYSTVWLVKDLSKP